MSAVDDIVVVAVSDVVVVYIDDDVASRVRVVDFKFFDDSRERTIPVRFWSSCDVIFSAPHDDVRIVGSLRHTLCTCQRKEGYCINMYIPEKVD